jgi:hypothetical protein
MSVETGIPSEDTMHAEHFDTTMNAYRDRVPYKPFTVVLVNGNRYEVDHPRALNIRDGVAVYLAAGGVPIIFDHEGVSEVIGDLKSEFTS